jgi:hypothetical protein
MKIFLFLFISLNLFSSSVKEFSLSSFSDFQRGKLEGLQITQNGLKLGILIEPLELVPEEVITAAVEDDFLYIGTSNGKIFRFKEKLEEIGKIDGGIITSILNYKGKIYIGTSYPANLYLYNGEIKKIFEFKEKSIFAISNIDDEIFIGTGEEGNLYKINNDKLEKVFETKQEGISSIFKRKNGDFFLSTFGKGLIYLIEKDKKKILYNSNYYQVSDFCEDGKGNIYFLLSSFPKVEEKDKKSVFASAIGVYEKGVFKILKEFSEKQIATLSYFEPLDTLIFGGSDGKLYGLKDGKESLFYSFPQKKVSFILKNFILTAESSQIFKYKKAEKGVYFSEVFDPKRESKWGKIFWSGEGNVSISGRFGPTSEPDSFWTSFKNLCKEKVCNFDEISNFAQIKIEIEKDGILENLFWLSKPKNLPPEIKGFKISKPGEVFLKQTSQEGIVAEATNPDRYGIFTTIDWPPPEGKDKGLKKAYKKGYITLSWDVSEPDGEEVEYDLYFQAYGENEWYPIFEGEKITFFSFDTTALPDGFYKFKLIAYDLPEKEKAEEVSQIFYIDNTSPEISYKKEKDKDIVKIKDPSRILKAEISCNGKNWEILNPKDGILDGLEEEFEVILKKECKFVVVRAMDLYYNVSTYLIKK